MSVKDGCTVYNALCEYHTIINDASREKHDTQKPGQDILLEIDKFGRGWSQKSRKQHFQMGGGAKTNYFTHSSRQLCEYNALAYAKE
jgi:hypothetical protein